MKYTAEEVRERVARAICAGCEENPDHLGDARGNDYRWQDYLDIADAAIDAHLAGMGEPVAQGEAATVVDLHDRIEFALRDAGFGLDEASTLAERATAEPVAQGEVVTGTFDCPICGSAEVHYHSASEVCAWAAAQANRFLISLGHPEIVMCTKDEDERRTADFRKRVADVEEMLRDAGHSYQSEYARLAAQPAQMERAAEILRTAALPHAVPDDEIRSLIARLRHEDDSDDPVTSERRAGWHAALDAVEEAMLAATQQADR